MKFVGFDIEIAKLVPDGEDWHNHTPLGVTCASLVADDLTEAFWAGKSAGEYHPFMSQLEAESLIIRMKELVGEGYTIVTWNGLGFDFPVMEIESGSVELCKRLAESHVDMMFHFMCVKGFPVGLDNVAKTMGLSGKPEGMHGDLAPVMWANGEYQKVIDYVIQDSQTTLDVAKLTTKVKGLKWTTKKGYVRGFYLDGGWENVQKCLEIPEPDMSWMDKPPKREDFTRWLNA